MAIVDISNRISNLDSDETDTLSDSIRRHLADEILAGRFPVNHRLDEQELAAKFEVSRTPVREAIRQLASAGLVDIRPRRGAVVVSVDPDKIGQAFEAAADLEALSAGWAAMRATLVEMTELIDLHEMCAGAITGATPDEFAAANREFHDKIADLARNESLKSATRLVRVQTAPFQRAQFQSAQERERSQKDHGEILAAICNQDRQAAERAMKNHILRASLAALRHENNKKNKTDETIIPESKRRK